MLSEFELIGLAARLRELDNMYNRLILPQNIRYELNTIIHSSGGVKIVPSRYLKTIVACLLNSQNNIYIDNSLRYYMNALFT